MNEQTQTRSHPGDDLHGHIRGCQELVGTDIQFAFQTILNARELEVVAFEALVRGLAGEPAATVISRIAQENRFDFDQACRIRALEAAARSEVEQDLHLNCAEIRTSNVNLVSEVIHHMARRYRIDSDNIVLEIAGLNRLGTRRQIAEIRRELQAAGLRTLADNVGLNHADLSVLAAFQPDMIKLDRALVAKIEQSRQRQAVIHGCMSLCKDLGIRLIAGGIETREEFIWLRDNGIEYFQGFYFTQPDLDAERR
jgi:EAL domain-containing protein (putative c-di-GMP-specific phosphodiesterase class I)